MDIEHVSLQYNRLARHYCEALEHKDYISFLDMSHCLRIWVDMKSEIDLYINSNGIKVRFTNTQKSKALSQVLKGSKFIYLPLSSGVESPGIQVKGFTYVDRALSPEEIKKLYEAGLTKAETKNIGFSEWLGSGIYQVPSNDPNHPSIWISREILIKRVANILGASHPMGTDVGEELENRFDVFVHDLHNIELADGYPATYYQLLEIAGDILEVFKQTFNPSPSLHT